LLEVKLLAPDISSPFKFEAFKSVLPACVFLLLLARATALFKDATGVNDVLVPPVLATSSCMCCTLKSEDCDHTNPECNKRHTQIILKRILY
jgi:hypothetical protein